MRGVLPKSRIRSIRTALYVVLLSVLLLSFYKGVSALATF